MPVTVGDFVPNLAGFEAAKTGPQAVAAMKAVVDEALPRAQADTPVADGSDSRYTRPGSKRKPGTARRSLKTRAGVADVEGVGRTAVGRLYSTDFVMRLIEDGTVNQSPHPIILPAVESVAAGTEVRR